MTYTVGLSMGDLTTLVRKPGQTYAEANGYKPGDKVKVTLTGVVPPAPQGLGDFNFVAYVDSATTGGGRSLYLANRKIESIAPAGKRWQPGDTIAIQYDPFGVEYTYVRGRSNWPGDGFPLSDDRVNELYAESKVRHLLRDAQPVAA